MLRRCRPLLGTFVEIECDRADAIDEGFAAIERVHRLMSAHAPVSDVSRVNRFAHTFPVEVHALTALVFERALFWARESGGEFDPVRAGKSAIESGLLPRHVDQPAPEASQWRWIEAHGRAVSLLKPGCVDLGGIAKGFAVDQAARAMRRASAASGLVNAGGDLIAFGPDAWRVTIIHPITRQALVEVELHDQALATSALLANGSGDHLPLGSEWISVTVRAANACDADALTKIVWTAPADLRDMLDRNGACAFGIRPDGFVEAIGPDRLAA
jgi:thiamine biosynthesis lipoprotein